MAPRSPRTGAPTLPVAISQSPLLSGALPDELFASFAGPLPTITITIGTFSSTSPSRVGTGRIGPTRPRAPTHGRIKPLSILSLSSPPSYKPSAPISPKQVVSLLDLLESMDNDIATEVQRVRLGIQETRTLVRACREDSTARESARQQLAKERR